MELDNNIQILKQLNSQNVKIINLLEDISKSSTIYERNYYDVSTSISTAVTTKPDSPDSASYTRHRIYEIIERNAKRLSIYNDGPGPLYVIILHKENEPSDEFPLYEGEAKTYLNIFEVKLRAPVVGLKYRITEYELWKQRNIDFRAGRGYIRNQTVAVGNANPLLAYNTSDLHDINAALQRNASTGYIKNRNPLNTIFFWISVDGTEFGQSGQGLNVEYGTIDPNGAANIDYLEVDSIRIGANANNVSYEIVVG